MCRRWYSVVPYNSVNRAITKDTTPTIPAVSLPKFSNMTAIPPCRMPKRIQCRKRRSLENWAKRPVPLTLKTGSGLRQDRMRAARFLRFLRILGWSSSSPSPRAPSLFRRRFSSSISFRPESDSVERRRLFSLSGCQSCGVMGRAPVAAAVLLFPR